MGCTRADTFRKRKFVKASFTVIREFTYTSKI